MICSPTLARARQILTDCRRARLLCANRHSHAQFDVLDLHRMHTGGALALRSPGFWNTACDGQSCPVSAPSSSHRAGAPHRPSPRLLPAPDGLYLYIVPSLPARLDGRSGSSAVENQK
eukprot:4113901-Pleurochrysis_carterae.AAC.1